MAVIFAVKILNSSNSYMLIYYHEHTKVQHSVTITVSKLVENMLNNTQIYLWVIKLFSQIFGSKSKAYYVNFHTHKNFDVLMSTMHF